MYNQYLNAQTIDAPPMHNQSFDEEAYAGAVRQTNNVPPQQAAAISELTRNLSGRLQHIKFDTNTVIMLAIIWFLLSDNGEVDWDQFLTIGILFLLGL